MSKFDEMMKMLEEMSRELDLLERPKVNFERQVEPELDDEDVDEFDTAFQSEPMDSSERSLMIYGEVVRMHRSLAKLAPGSNLARKAISRKFFDEKIDGKYDRDGLLGTLEAALDTGRTVHAIVKHEQEGNLSLEVIRAVYAVLDTYKALAFEQIVEFMNRYGNGDPEELLAFVNTDWFAEQYWNVRADRRRAFLQAIGHAIGGVYGGGLAQATNDITDHHDEFQDRMARSSRSQRARLYMEMGRQLRYDNRR